MFPFLSIYRRFLTLRQTDLLEAIRTFHEGRYAKLYEEAIYVLQDGKKITQKPIAACMGISIRNLRRDHTEKHDEVIKKYNATLKLIKRGKGHH